MITQDQLKEVLTYDPDTGLFWWKNGKQAGTLTNKGTVHIMIDYVAYQAHRLAFVYMGVPIPAIVDHKNRVRSDNRWHNLRSATHGQNKMNSEKYAGVEQRPSGRWSARIKTKAGNIACGTYDTREEAMIAYNAKRREIYGEYAP